MTHQTQPRTDRRVHRMLLLVAVLLFCCAIVFPAAAEHHCIFDLMAKKTNPSSTTVVLALPRQKRSGRVFMMPFKSEWEPIRIRFFTEDLNTVSSYCTTEGDIRPTFDGHAARCTHTDILTDAKRNIIVNQVLPQAIKLHEERLFVQRVRGRIYMPMYTFNHYCSFFKVPPSHRTEGVEDADMVLYISAGPTNSLTAAWSASCVSVDRGRPVIGVINFNPSRVIFNEHSVRTAAHEIAHTLGFSSFFLEDLGMLSTRGGVRGKPKVILVSSAKTLEKARAHYNCPTAPGMELEDEGSGRTINSHWEMRNAKDELMAGKVGVGYYTSLTMAAFEDMGFYRANWSMAETMNWGRNSGCEFLEKRCLVGGKTAYPNMFCNRCIGRDKLLSCTSDHMALGSCAILHYDHVPPQYRYFDDPTASGSESNWMDYCPFIQPYSNTKCADGNPHVLPGCRLGPTSRCVRGENLYFIWRRLGDVCADVRCDNGTVSLRFIHEVTWMVCPEGSQITLTGVLRGKIVCPKYSQICRETGSDKSKVDLSQ